MKRKLILVFGLIAPALLLAGVVQAQTPYRVEYFSNANTTGAPDASLRLDNDGSAPLNLCADIFVFDTNEELSECCACLETPDGLRTLSVNNDLTSRPLTGVVLTSGVIKIVAAFASSGLCPAPDRIELVPGAEIQSWATHIQNTTFAITEAASPVSNLSSTEVSNLAKQCGAILKTSSPGGICSCGTGS